MCILLTIAQSIPFQTMPKPAQATLYMTTHCAHCSAMINTLTTLTKEGLLGQLTLINLTVAPQLGEQKTIRSVPHLSLGSLELSGIQSRADLLHSINLQTHQHKALNFINLLNAGNWQKVLAESLENKKNIDALFALLIDDNLSLQSRIGLMVVFEELVQLNILSHFINQFAQVLQQVSDKIRIDLLYLLSIIEHPDADRLCLNYLNDNHSEIKEIAIEVQSRQSK